MLNAKLELLSRMQSQEIATWFFGGIGFFFLLAVFIFGPKELPHWKERALAFIASILAGIFAFFLSGNMLLVIEPKITEFGKVAIQAGYGFAMFAVVLWWWQPALKTMKKGTMGEKEELDKYAKVLQYLRFILVAVLFLGVSLTTLFLKSTKSNPVDQIKRSYEFAKEYESIGEYYIRVGYPQKAVSSWSKAIDFYYKSGSQSKAIELEKRIEDVKLEK